jgi:hypothetical protein
MKFLSAKLTVALLAFSMLFAFCSKEKELPRPIPGTPGKPNGPAPVSAAFRFAAQINLIGQPYHPSSLHAVVSVANEKGEPVLTDKQLTLEIGEHAVTQTLSLPVGQYKLTSFRMVHGGVNTRFAAPIAGSAKAQQVQTPLVQNFAVKQEESVVVPVAALPVAAGERPQLFGYPAGAFDNNQEETNPFATIKVKAQIKVGNVLYDNTAASLIITTYGANGERTTTYSSLKAGINNISLAKAATRYTLTVTKWGTSSDLHLNRSDLDLDTIYTFSTEKDPKVLKSEVTHKQVNGQYVPLNKKMYVYNGAGKLSEVQYAFRQNDGSILRGITDRLSYSGNNVGSVSHYNEKAEKVWATSFAYDAANRVTSINHQQGEETTAGVVSYDGMPATSMGITYTVTKPGYHYQVVHTRALLKGNMQQYSIVHAGHQTENGMSDFDEQINPYFFLNLPDVYLSHLNQNNTTNEYKYYNGTTPEAVPYRSDYTYDADGYPKEVIRHYRTFKGGVSKHAYATKTTFEYQ